jgi:predicted aconitase with swiveling domain
VVIKEERLKVSKSFQGRPILPGAISGKAMVSRSGFNAYACFYNSLQEGVSSAECADSGNKDLFGKRLDGMIICLPNTIGSTSAGAVWQRIARLGVAPLAMLFSLPIDSMAAGGLIVADIWAEKRIITIDQLGKEFLDNVAEGDQVSVQVDGTVIIN